MALFRRTSVFLALCLFGSACKDSETVPSRQTCEHPFDTGTFTFDDACVNCEGSDPELAIDDSPESFAVMVMPASPGGIATFRLSTPQPVSGVVTATLRLNAGVQKQLTRFLRASGGTGQVEYKETALTPGVRDEAHTFTLVLKAADFTSIEAGVSDTFVNDQLDVLDVCVSQGDW